jgi:hypothetical protein
MVRYEIRCHKEGTPQETAALERAFMRMLEGAFPALQGVGVREHNGHLQIWMDFEGSVERARHRAEDAFSEAWYDAFGELGSAHLGWVVGDPTPLSQAAPDDERRQATKGGSR